MALMLRFVLDERMCAVRDYRIPEGLYAVVGLIAVWRGMAIWRGDADELCADNDGNHTQSGCRHAS